MKKYDIKSEELTQLLELFYRIFRIHISFFDVQEYELLSYKPFKRSNFCRLNRMSEVFNSKCSECDKINLLIAKKTRNIHIYKCHQRLLEGIVPLYDEHSNYLGSLFFGQIRENGSKIPEWLNGNNIRYYEELPEYDIEKLQDIAKLLKGMSEYVVRNEIVKYHNKPWCEKVERYIKNNIKKRVTISELAKLINKSPTFITHRFPEEFGTSPKQYILELKMQKAKMMLEDGETIYNVASEFGFFDEFHFSKTFKKFWGKSPKNYKKN